MNTFSYKEDEWKNNASDYEKFSGFNEYETNLFCGPNQTEEDWTPWDDIEEEYDGMSNVWDGITSRRRINDFRE